VFEEICYCATSFFAKELDINLKGLGKLCNADAVFDLIHNFLSGCRRCMPVVVYNHGDAESKNNENTYKLQRVNRESKNEVIAQKGVHQTYVANHLNDRSLFILCCDDVAY
jgi:hypothetical protein